MKLNTHLLYDTAIPLLGRNEGTYLQKYFSMNAHDSFIHNNPKLETAQVFVNKSMDLFYAMNF